jgi:hypothetical protein
LRRITEGPSKCLNPRQQEKLETKRGLIILNLFGELPVQELAANAADQTFRGEIKRGKIRKVKEEKKKEKRR